MEKEKKNKNKNKKKMNLTNIGKKLFAYIMLIVMILSVIGMAISALAS